MRGIKFLALALLLSILTGAKGCDKQPESTCPSYADKQGVWQCSPPPVPTPAPDKPLQTGRQPAPTATP